VEVAAYIGRFIGYGYNTNQLDSSPGSFPSVEFQAQVAAVKDEGSGGRRVVEAAQYWTPT
jgi:hypothetical protein